MTLRGAVIGADGAKRGADVELDGSADDAHGPWAQYHS